MSDLLRESCYVAGRWIEGTSWIEVDNPATESVIGRVPRFGREETEHAIAAGQAAMPGWAARTAAERAAVLRRLHGLMLSRLEDLAQLLTIEQGKPIGEARAEIRYAADYVEWFAEEAKRTYGEVIPSHRGTARLLVLQQPIGVVGAITPWNFPSAMVARKIAPALAAGCSVVLKPASQTPFSALALAALAEEAGLPGGVLNVVTGNAAEISAALTQSEIVRKISFTGSTEVGAKLFAASAPTIKKLSLELGGNAPFIVFEDADIDAAVAGAVDAKFRNAGQTCVCVNRIYVADGIYDAFTSALSAAVQRLTVGDGLSEETNIGPLIDRKAVAKVSEHVEDALAKGARIVGAPARVDRRFHAPIVLADVTAEMNVCHEETFGPLAAVSRFHSEEEAIGMANATEFGLAGYFFTRDISRVWRVAERLECGMVGINTGLVSTAVAPFGGIKSSGIGREGSRHGILDYMELKYLCMEV